MKELTLEEAIALIQELRMDLDFHKAGHTCAVKAFDDMKTRYNRANANARKQYERAEALRKQIAQLLVDADDS